MPTRQRSRRRCVSALLPAGAAGGARVGLNSGLICLTPHPTPTPPPSHPMPNPGSGGGPTLGLHRPERQLRARAPGRRARRRSARLCHLHARPAGAGAAGDGRPHAAHLVGALPLPQQPPPRRRSARRTRTLPLCPTTQWRVEFPPPPLPPASEYVVTIQRFVETRRAYEWGLVAQALAGGMRGVLQDWELMVAQLETQVGGRRRRRCRRRQAQAQAAPNCC